MKRVLTLAGPLFAALTVAVAVAAAAPAGIYRGHWGKSKSAKVSFRVVGATMRNFHTNVAALCLGKFREQTFIVPRAAIKGNRVKTTYEARDRHGRGIAKLSVTATFHGSRASGTFSGASFGCTIAKYHWTASRR